MNLSDIFPLVRHFNSTIEPVSNIRWISDIILTDPRRTGDEGDILSSMSISGGWLQTMMLLIIHAISFIFNIFFIMILVGRRKTRKVMKLRVMLTAISVLNVIFNVTWFICIVIHYLVNLEGEETLIDDLDQQFSQIVWEIFGHQCVDSLLAVQSVFLLSLSMDRYLNLFIDYSPYVGGWCEIILIFTIPFLLGVIIFDHRWVEMLVPRSSALFARLCGLLLPHLLSFVLLLVSSMRPPPTFDYEPRMASSLAKSLPIVLFMIVTTDLFARAGIFFELLELNFGFIIVTGSDSADYYLSHFFRGWYQLSHILIHCFPLYFVVSLILFVRHYRQMAGRILPSCCCFCCGERREKVDYSSETIRSMMAEQRKKRILQASMH